MLATLTNTEASAGTKPIDQMSVAELRAELEGATKGIDLRPAPKIVSFEC